MPRATLRIWERRYGYPQPARNDAGERVYTIADIDKLRLVQQLIDQGARPGALVGMTMAELHARLAPSGEQTRPGGASALVGVLHRRDSGALLRLLRQELARLGVARFVLERAAPWSREVGDAWSSGEIQVYEEHLFATMLQLVLGEAVVGLAAGDDAAPPRVLLTTVEGELHALGLWMVHALLALEGCDCAMLGVSTPPAQVAEAALCLGADVVALSFSASMNPARAQRDISFLRERLPSTTVIWVGGACIGLRRAEAMGVKVFDTLEDLPAAVASYRLAHGQVERA